MTYKISMNWLKQVCCDLPTVKINSIDDESCLHVTRFIGKLALAYDMLFTMSQTPLNCHTQDLLEAAIVQKRRLQITCLLGDEQITYDKVLPVDINSQDGVERLTILTTDNEGGILKLDIETNHIMAFCALDSKHPAISFSRQ